MNEKINKIAEEIYKFALSNDKQTTIWFIKYRLRNMLVLGEAKGIENSLFGDKKLEESSLK